MSSNRTIRKIALVSLVHGDETLGLDIMRSIKNKKFDGILLDCLIANGRAHELGRRFVDSDLNRSFGTEQDTFESGLAKDLKARLKGYDMVIDLHDTPAMTDPFLILTRFNSEMLSQLEYFPIKKVVIMSDCVASGKALIDNCNGVSIELDRNNPKSIELCRNALCSFLKKSVPRSQKEFYLVFDKLGFGTATKPLRNFEETATNVDGRLIKFYPVLFGETDYDFKCLMATKVPKSTLINKFLRI